MEHRIARVNELVKQKTAEVLTEKINLKPGIFVTVTRVDTAPDFRYARVFVSIFPEQEIRYVSTALSRELIEIQNRLNKTLKMRIIPRIQFKVDTTEIEADKVEQLLRKIGEK